MWWRVLLRILQIIVSLAVFSFLFLFTGFRSSVIDFQSADFYSYAFTILIGSLKTVIPWIIAGFLLLVLPEIVVESKQVQHKFKKLIIACVIVFLLACLHLYFQNKTEHFIALFTTRIPIPPGTTALYGHGHDHQIGARNYHWIQLTRNQPLTDEEKINKALNVVDFYERYSGNKSIAAFFSGRYTQETIFPDCKELVKTKFSTLVKEQKLLICVYNTPGIFPKMFNVMIGQIMTIEYFLDSPLRFQ